MKKQILLLLVAVLLNSVAAFAQGGTTGPLIWNINNGVLTISGEGDMPDYSIESGMYPPWVNYSLYFDAVNVEYGVTSIGDIAFYTFENLNTVTLSNSVTHIGFAAFCNCPKLISITLPNSVTNIANNAFGNCENMTSIDVESGNDTYTSVDGVLIDKSKATLVCCPAGKKGAFIVPNNVKSIEESAFFRCQKLTSIIIPNSVLSIGNSAFEYCTSLISVDLSKNVTSIGNNAFYGCENLISVDLSNSVTSIGSSAFHSCTSLTSFSIPNCLTSIESLTFNDCKHLTSITIPNSVISIEDYAFAGCNNLTSVTITNLDPAPIVINLSTFIGVNIKECMLRVPTSAVSIYQNTFVWKEFNIVGDGFLVNPIANNNKYGNTSGNGLYKANETATLTATAYNGYKFANWTKNGVVVSTNNSYSFMATEDVELVANFENNVGVENIGVATVKIYPNPTTGELRIESESLRIESIIIYNISGKILKTENWKTENTIDISHLPSGIYFVKISTEVGEVTKKVMKYN